MGVTLSLAQSRRTVVCTVKMRAVVNWGNPRDPLLFGWLHIHTELILLTISLKCSNISDDHVQHMVRACAFTRALLWLCMWTTRATRGKCKTRFFDRRSILSFLTWKYTAFMFIGTFFIALAGLKLLTEYWSKGKGDGPDRRQSDPLLASTNDSSVSKRADTVTTTPRDSNVSLKVASESDSNMQDGSSAAEARSMNDNLGVEKSTSSDTCADLQATSGVTDDSGYVETSDKSMNSYVGGDSFIADDETKGTQPAINVHVDEPKPTIFTPDITDTTEDKQLSHESCFDSLTGMIKYVITDDSAPSTAVEDTLSVRSDCDNNDVALCDPAVENDDSMSIASDTSLVSNITSKELLEMNAWVERDDEVDWCDAVIYRVDSYQHAKRNGISLEVVERTEGGSSLLGTVLVVNECYKKTVAVRHSCDDWDTFEDTQAQWVETIENGALDRFQFRVKLPEGSYSMEFALSFNDKWDNNDSQNYCVSCTA